MTFQEIVERLPRETGLPIALMAKQKCRVLFDDDAEVDIEVVEQGGERLMLKCLIGSVPPTGHEVLFTALLQANVHQRGMGGAVLAIDEGSQIVLIRSMMINTLPYEDFLKSLERFVVNAKSWRERVATSAYASLTAH